MAWTKYQDQLPKPGRNDVYGMHPLKKYDVSEGLRVVKSPLRSMCLLGAFILAESTFGFVQAEHSEQASEDAAKTPAAASTQPQQASVALVIPQPIAEANLDRFARVLRLSEAQRKYLQASLEEYRAALDKVDVEFRDDLIRLSREVAVTLQAGYSPEAARGYDRLLDVQDEVIARQARLDDEFFERLTVALDDSQLTYLERAKQLRRREQCFPLYVFVPWAQIDLSEFIESFGLGPDVLAEIDAMLIDYEHRVTPMFVELRESIDRHASAKVWGVVKAKYDSDGKPYAPDSEAAAKYAAEYFQMNDATLARQSSLMKRIGELNESVLAQILPLVDEPQRSAIRETFNSRAYPDVFPDPSDPIEVYRGLANSENLTEADREVLSALWSSYREQYDAKCRLMLESYKSWREQLARNEVHGDAQRYSMEMRRWRMERSELNRVVVGQIQQTLSNQLNQQQVEAIQAYLNRMVKLREYTN